MGYSMIVYMYNDECEPISDKVVRERFLLEEEANRVKTFVQDVYSEFGIEVDGVNNQLDIAVKMLRSRLSSEPDNAAVICRYLNRAAAIGWDFHWHCCYIRKFKLPIDPYIYLP